MNPLAAIQFQHNMTPTQANANTSQGASGSGVDYNLFHFFTAEQEYNGETFEAGEFMFGDNSTGVENLVYKSGNLQARVGNTTYVTFGSTGIRLVNGGLTLKQSALSLGSGSMDLDSGNGGSDSYINIYATTGAFTINSILEPSNPNMLLFLLNTSANDMTINHLGAAPGGYWQIYTLDASSPNTTGPGFALLLGDEQNERWTLLSLTT